MPRTVTAPRLCGRDAELERVLDEGVARPGGLPARRPGGRGGRGRQDHPVPGRARRPDDPTGAPPHRSLSAPAGGVDPLRAGRRDPARHLPLARRRAAREAAPVVAGGVRLAAAGPRPGSRGDARSDRAPSSSAQSRLFEGFLSLIGDLTPDADVVWLVEDVHWADRSTLDLLAFLGRNLTRERLLLLITVRTDELHREHPLRAWLHEMGRLPGVTRLDLPRLGREATGEQLRSVAASSGLPPVDEARLDALFERSAGNPLFSEELLAWTSDPRPAAPREPARPGRRAAGHPARLDAALPRRRGRAGHLRRRVAGRGRRRRRSPRPSRRSTPPSTGTCWRRSGETTYAFVHPIFREILEAELLSPGPAGACTRRPRAPSPRARRSPGTLRVQRDDRPPLGAGPRARPRLPRRGPGRAGRRADVRLRGGGRLPAAGADAGRAGGRRHDRLRL